MFLVLALMLAACSTDKASSSAPEESPSPKPVEQKTECPLTGKDAPPGVSAGRPAIGVKIENNPVAYPLAGLEKAELVYEELVEGGMTRFLAMFHCTDTKKAGPVRSARIVDPAIMGGITRILGAAGGNAIVRKELKKRNIITIDEPAAGAAMRRIPRAGLTLEHTLYGNTVALRKLGQKRFEKAPPDDLFVFGDLKAKGRKARSFTVEFSPVAQVVYRWRRGRWHRWEDGRPFVAEDGKQIAVDNVLIEEHNIIYSKRLFDIAGNPSIEVKDPTGSGRAILFRDGRAIYGRWVRRSVKEPVTFKTKSGKPLLLAKGTTWVELVPSRKGQVKGGVRLGG